MTIHIPRTVETISVSICMEGHKGYHTEVPMAWTRLYNGYDYYTGEVTLEHCDLYFYYFRIVTDQPSEFKLFKQGSRDTNIGVGEKWQLTCYDKNYDTPRHYKGSVIYQIFPDRFYKIGDCDVTDKLQPYTVHDNLEDTPHYYPDLKGEIKNNDFYGGNLKGIEAKLPYLQKLHVTVIYLNPIFKAYSNHRYDTADYMQIDPMLGTEEDFVQLCHAAHELGMKIILDGVFSHVGSNSVYFDIDNIFGNGAYHHLTSPYASWFQFTQFPHRYVCWWGIHTLPHVDELDESYMDFIVNGENSVVRHWLMAGADGFRLDVADELPDAFILRLNQVVKEVKPDSIVIGEVWEDASNKESYGVKRQYFTQSELDSVMNYPYKDAIQAFVRGEHSAAQLSEAIMTIAENYPKPVLDCLMNSLSTHDTMRILTAVGVDDFNLTKEAKASHKLSDVERITAIDKTKLAVLLQYTLPGSPCIYYGDEAGLEGFEDPFNRRFFPWDELDGQLLGFYQELGRLKSEYEALSIGNIEVIIEENRIFGFTRACHTSIVTVIVSLDDKPYERESITGTVLISHNCVCLQDRIILNKYGFILFRNADMAN